MKTEYYRNLFLCFNDSIVYMFCIIVTGDLHYRTGSFVLYFYSSGDHFVYAFYNFRV